MTRGFWTTRLRDSKGATSQSIWRWMGECDVWSVTAREEQETEDNKQTNMCTAQVTNNRIRTVDVSSLKQENN